MMDTPSSGERNSYTVAGLTMKSIRSVIATGELMAAGAPGCRVDALAERIHWIFPASAAVAIHLVIELGSFLKENLGGPAEASASEATAKPAVSVR
jgi:hypothetical protein